MNRSTSTTTSWLNRWARAFTGLLTFALIAGCAGKKPACDGADADGALQSLFKEQTARILQHYA